MPSLETYKKMLSCTTNGELHKRQSDQIIEDTWDEDIASCVAYLYDQAHDENFQSYQDYEPSLTNKVAVEIKFYEMEYHTLSKDEVPFHIMFRPSCDLDGLLYDKNFENAYYAHFPIGLYIDIPDGDGLYGRWLIVDQYRENAKQFPSYLVLPCDYKLQWIYKGKKYESWSVLRSQNSYNSGIWTDYRMTSVENQKVVLLPYNSKTQTIYYGQRMVISTPREIPITWKCSKVEDLRVHGICQYTFTQDKWNDETDFIELDDSNNVLGMWADYNASAVKPKDDTEPQFEEHKILRAEIHPIGKADITIGYTKKLTLSFFNDENDEIEVLSGRWEFEIDSEDATKFVTVTTLSPSEVELILNCDDEYIGEILLATYVSYNGITTQIELEIGG